MDQPWVPSATVAIVALVVYLICAIIEAKYGKKANVGAMKWWAGFVAFCASIALFMALGAIK